MSTLNTKLSIGVYGGAWAQTTVSFLKTTGICPGRVNLFEYTHREALSFDQDDIFIITDFGKPAEAGWEDNDGYWLKRLNELREIVWSRSMKSTIFANNNDADVNKALRESCTRVVKVDAKDSIIPQSFALAVLIDLYGKSDSLAYKPELLKPVAA